MNDAPIRNSTKKPPIQLGAALLAQHVEDDVQPHPRDRRVNNTNATNSISANTYDVGGCSRR